MINEMELKFKATLANELLARQSVVAFIAPLNPTFDEIGEIKTIISEAVSNAIIHGYHFDASKDVYLKAVIYEDYIEIIVKDFGVGIEDIKKAKEAHYTTRPDLERADMGLTIIETLSDDFSLKSVPGMGCKLVIKKNYKSLKVQSE